MRALFAQDKSGAGRPGVQVDQGGGFGDPGAVTQTTCGVDRGIPAVGEVEGVDGVLDAGVNGEAERESHPSIAAGLREAVGGPGGVAAHQHPRLVGIARVAGIVAATGFGPPRRR